MNDRRRLRIALQRSGRLSEKSLVLLERCGVDLEWSKDRLFIRSEDFPLDVMLVRDDDIPEYVADGVCELGIVGQNVLSETLAAGHEARPDVKVLRKLAFGQCRLMLAVPKETTYDGVASLAGKRVATSYPTTLGRFLRDRGVTARIVELSGSVEIAPTLDIADAICDLVSTGNSLRSNGLREVDTVLESESVLVQTGQPLNGTLTPIIDRFVQRIDGVMKAAQAKYVMMNAPASAVDSIRGLIPGMEEPTVIPLAGLDDRVALHAVAREPIFWETMERLKDQGATSILVVPIEKIIE